MKKLILLFVALTVVLFAVPTFAQEPTVTKTTWGALKTGFAQPAPTPAATTPTQSIPSETGRAIVRPGAEPSSAAPYVSGYRIIKATSIIKTVDRNEGDDDYLITFDLPIYYCPADWKVLAMTWYGVWNDQTARLQPYGFSATSTGYRMKFIYGNGKAWRYGIAMSPSNWAVYFR